MMVSYYHTVSIYRNPVRGPHVVHSGLVAAESCGGFLFVPPYLAAIGFRSGSHDDKPRHDVRAVFGKGYGVRFNFK